MTLHWWMHWFWITLLAISVCMCSPVIPTADTSDGDISEATPAATEPEYNIDHAPATSSATTIPPPVIPLTRGHRGGKAIGQPPPNSSTISPYLKISVAFPLAESSDTGDEGPALQKELSLHLDYNKKSQTKVEEKSTTTETPVITEKVIINTTEASSLDEAVTEIINLNISDPSNATSDVLVPNNASEVKEVENVTSNVTESNVTNSTVVEVSDNKTVTIEESARNSTNSNKVIVEISTVRALLLETNVGRRAADGEVRKNALPNDDEGLDAGAVAGICFGSLVVIGLAGAISLVLYRRRYLNKPQTLNDKCSNPDSSGYIDDSTMRENSEEMYSLDNDSFLNSLEAMTIQNYWTDSVKHTKL